MQSTSQRILNMLNAIIFQLRRKMASKVALAWNQCDLTIFDIFFFHPPWMRFLAMPSARLDQGISCFGGADEGKNVHQTGFHAWP
jgi:hypothetical protein